MEGETVGEAFGCQAVPAWRVPFAQLAGRRLLASVLFLSWASFFSAQAPAGGPASATDLFAAVRRGDLKAVESLAKAGGAVQARDREGMTPLHYAAFQGRAAVIKVLLAAGGDPKAADSIGMTPLHAAAYAGHEEAVRILLEAKAPLDAQDSFGMTPMHYAVINVHPGVLRILLERGGRRDITDRQGRTAEELAKASGKAELQSAFVGPQTGTSRPAVVVTDDTLQLPPTTGYVAPPPPDPCCPQSGTSYSNWGDLASMEAQLQRYQTQERDLEARLPGLQSRCEEAPYSFSDSSGFSSDGSYSRQEEMRRRRVIEQVCGEYRQAMGQLEYLKEAEASLQRSIESLRLQGRFR